MHDLIQMLESRAVLYKTIGALYQLELDPERLAALQAIRFPEDAESPALQAAAARLNAAAVALREQDLDELAADYARVFLSAGIAEGSAAFPFESIYTSRDKLIMQDAYEDMVRILRAHAMVPARRDLYADHIGIELEFMGLLSEKAARALAGGHSEDAEKLLAESAAFLKKHLLGWIFRFLDDLEKLSGKPLYLALAAFTRAFLEEDRKWLEA